MKLKDVYNLSGSEFENLCCELLNRAGFQVQQTKLSGDGGVDIYAYNTLPFYCGKYIIQCKRYAGSVGEPVLRDLYGVITAERANKGILITTGTFTANAKSFSLDKNIELIDGELLNTVLIKYNIIQEDTADRKSSFADYKCFDKNKYSEFIRLINNGTITEDLSKEMLFDFLFGYFSKSSTKVVRSSDYYDMIYSGLTDEYLRLYNWYTEKYCNSKKKQAELNFYNNEYRDIVGLYNFDIFQYVSDRYCFLKTKLNFGIGYNGFYYDALTIHRSKEKIGNHNKSDLLNSSKKKLHYDYTHYIELMNLLSLFTYFDIKKGITLVNKLLWGSMSEFEDLFKSQKEYADAVSGVKIHFCINDTSKTSKAIAMTDYFDKFKCYQSDKIKEEINSIKILLS